MRDNTAEVIAGTRPVGSCKPDGSHQWVTRSFFDGQYSIVVYDGWLIDSETKTTDSSIAEIISNYLREVI
jgi:hypothetical protein